RVQGVFLPFHRRLPEYTVYINSPFLVLKTAARKQIERIAVERSPCYPQEPSQTDKSRLDPSGLALEGRRINRQSWSPLFRAFASSVPALPLCLIAFQGCLLDAEWSGNKVEYESLSGRSV